MPAPRSIIDRFHEKYMPEPNSGCWLWTGGASTAGYGQIGLGNKVLYAHRLSYEIHHGTSIPNGLEVCHRCDVPLCVNPDHLFLGSHRDNFADAASKGRIARQIGEACGAAKISEQDVIAIRADGRTTRAIAKDYGLSNRNVSAIKRRETWRHVK